MKNSMVSTDPQWDALKINESLCEKYRSMMFCNLDWPCVYNGMKEVCDDRGIWNCTSKTCSCFEGFINTANRARPEDRFLSCDIGIEPLFNDTLPMLPNDFIAVHEKSFIEKKIETEEYQLPTTIMMRVWTVGYLVEEFNEAVNDTQNAMVPEKKRQLRIQTKCTVVLVRISRKLSNSLSYSMSPMLHISTGNILNILIHEPKKRTVRC